MVFVISQLKAQITQDKQFYGKSDPYCTILIGNQKFQTTPHKNGARNPKWNQQFTFNGFANQFKIQLSDKDTAKDNFYGEGVLNLSKWTTNPGVSQTDCVNIFLKGKKSALVTLTIQYLAQGEKLGWGSVPTSNQQSNNGGYNNPSSLGY